MPQALVLQPFGEDELSRRALAAPHSRQLGYLRYYFADLGATTVLEEPRYFDRDYLDEFSAFYSRSVRGYPNHCRRLHFFSAPGLTRAEVEVAVGGDQDAVAKLNQRYLGFVVLRPIAGSPLGRTVVRWYAERTPEAPRITQPSRIYTCHVAGVGLSVRGLAWQQQDTGVGACATVALWSMFHSSAFDAHHAIPTTAKITMLAHQSAAEMSRVFPSTGLTYVQLMGAITACDLAPIVLTGDSDTATDGHQCFTRARFSSSCAALIRSGYAVLIGGVLGTGGGHAVCAVGFREADAPTVVPGEIALQDGAINYVYIHDDNIGPGARFQIHDESGHVVLRRSPPTPLHSPSCADPSASYEDFTPTNLIAAVHNDLRTSLDALHAIALAIGDGLVVASGDTTGATVSTRLIGLVEYMESELARMFVNSPERLKKARLALVEDVDAMSLHLGLVRIGFGSGPGVDVLYDTTETDNEMHAFCHLCYAAGAEDLTAKLQAAGADLGVLINLT